MRPLSVTLICWFLIIVNLYTCYSTYMNLNNPTFLEELRGDIPISINLFFTINFLGIAIILISSFAMLRGQNWGRMLWMGWTVLNIIIISLTLSMKIALLPGLLFIILLYYLFHPRADLFFHSNEKNPLVKSLP